MLMRRFCTSKLCRSDQQFRLPAPPNASQRSALINASAKGNEWQMSRIGDANLFYPVGRAMAGIAVLLKGNPGPPGGPSTTQPESTINAGLYCGGREALNRIAGKALAKQRADDFPLACSGWVKRQVHCCSRWLRARDGQHHGFLRPHFIGACGARHRLFARRQPAAAVSRGALSQHEHPHAQVHVHA